MSVENCKSVAAGYSVCAVRFGVKIHLWCSSCQDAAKELGIKIKRREDG